MPHYTFINPLESIVHCLVTFLHFNIYHSGFAILDQTILQMKTLAIFATWCLLYRCIWAKCYDSEDLIGSESCPPWYHSDGEGKCVFNHELSQIVHQFNNTSELEIGFCMTVTNGSQIIAQCPYVPTSTYNFSQYHTIYQVLPSQLDQVNDSMCAQFNRKGYLCSDCKDGYGLAAYRYYGLMCVKCSNSGWKWIAYVLLLFTPQTIFFIFFLMLSACVNSGSITGILNFSHTIITLMFFFPSLISIPQRLFGHWPVNILLSLYGAWSLNLMQFLIPPFCVSERLTTLQLISLGYVPSLYPILLCIITHYLIQLRDQGNWLLVKIHKS